MNTVEFVKALREIYPNSHFDKAFPNNTPDSIESCIGIYLYGGSAHKYLSTGTIKYQFISSNKDRQLAEKNANEIMSLLYDNQLNEQIIDSTKIKNVEFRELCPIYIGKDEQNRYQFSFNVEIQCYKLK